MNITYINHYAGNIKLGMEFRPYYLAREWVRMGHNVSIIASSFSHVRIAQPTCDQLFTEEWIDGIRFVWLNNRTYSGNGIGRAINIFQFLFGLYQSRRWLSEKPDIIICSSTYPLDIYPAKKIGDKSGAKIIWEIHDLWPLTPIEVGSMSKHNPFIMMLLRGERDSFRYANAIVSLLPNADQYLQKYGQVSDKYVYIPNGINPEEWDNAVADEIPSQHLSVILEKQGKGNLLVGYTGAHGAANVLGQLLDAAVLCKDKKVSFILVGDGVEKDKLMQRAKSEKLNNVRFLPPVKKVEIPALLQLMDALFIGLQRELRFKYGISPNKLMDYMMSRKPIVYAGSPHTFPIQEAACALIVPPENPESLAGAINELLDMPNEQRDLLGSNGHKYVLSNHSYSVLATTFVELMEKIHNNVSPNEQLPRRF